jgi:hypothetical protein
LQDTVFALGSVPVSRTIESRFSGAINLNWLRKAGLGIGLACLENAGGGYLHQGQGGDRRDRPALDVIVSGAARPAGRYELVVIDTAPLGVVADAYPLLREVDEAVHPGSSSPTTGIGQGPTRRRRAASISTATTLPADSSASTVVWTWRG